MRFASVAVLALYSLSFTACGGDDDDDVDVNNSSPISDNCSGTRLTEDQLCQLECGVTSRSEAQDILGQPTASSGGLLEYNYTCLSAGSGEVMSWDFYFSGDGDQLTNVNVTATGSNAGTTVPDCLAACAR